MLYGIYLVPATRTYAGRLEGVKDLLQVCGDFLDGGEVDGPLAGVADGPAQQHEERHELLHLRPLLPEDPPAPAPHGRSIVDY